MDMFREITIQGGNFSNVYGIRPNTIILGRDRFEALKKQCSGLMNMEMETDEPDRIMGMKIILCEKDPEYFNIAFRDPSLEI